MKPGLTKKRIVAAGLDVLETRGLDGLTVRAVATVLGVQAPALYWHVKSKQDLLDEMATELWRRILDALEQLDPAASWGGQMEAFARSMRRVLLAHRDGAKVFGGTFFTDSTVLARQEQTFQRMLSAGFALADIVRGWSLLYNFVLGFVIEEQAVAQAMAAGDERYSLEARAERVGTEGHDLVIESGALIFASPDERFADLVGIIIDAAERLP